MKMVIVKQELNNLPEDNYFVTYEQMNTLIAFQKLWTQLSVWLRSLLISTTEDLENKTAVMNQLHTIPTQFYNIFKLFYGPLISQQLSNILTNFISESRSFIEASKNKDIESVNSSTRQMYETADQLADFLSKINVYWGEEQWKNLLYQFIKLFIDETTAMISGNYDMEIMIFNRLDEVTDIMGSYMARGIIARSISNVPGAG